MSVPARGPSDEEILEFKRNYWTKPGIGAEYHHFALEPAPITRAKNIVEFGFVLAHTLGPRVLDAGAGTGRFQITLRKAGHKAVALDYSLDMLRTAISSARRQSLDAPCTRGDVFKMPFRDDTFDSVVSMTVIRHFPQWREILAEYARVVRPGGRIVFDAASGDQESFMRRHYGRESVGKASAPMNFNAPVSLMDIYAIASKLGMRIHWMGPYDFFNENALLKHIHGEAYAPFLDALKGLLSTDDAIAVYFMLSRHVLGRVSPACSSSWFIVLEKGHRETDPPRWPQFPRGFQPKSVEELVEAALSDDPRRSRELVASLQALRNVSHPGKLLAYLDEQFVASVPGPAWNWALPT